MQLEVHDGAPRDRSHHADCLLPRPRVRGDPTAEIFSASRSALVSPSFERAITRRAIQWVSSTPSAGRTVFGVETLCLRDHLRSPFDSGVRGRPDRPLPTEIRSRAEIQRAAVAIYLLTSRHDPRARARCTVLASRITRSSTPHWLQEGRRGW